MSGCLEKQLLEFALNVNPPGGTKKEKKNMNKNEEQFAHLLEKQGKVWVYEPIRFDLDTTTYCPDFYCPDNNIFYEVIGTACAFYNNRHKYENLIKKYPLINLKIVKPDGTAFNPKPLFKGKARKKNKTICRQVKISIQLDDQLINIAEKECRTIASVIRQAIKEYLERRGK